MQDALSQMIQQQEQKRQAQRSTLYDNRNMPNAWGPQQVPANYQSMSETNGLMQRAASKMLGNTLNNSAGYTKTAGNMAKSIGMPSAGTGSAMGSATTSSGLGGVGDIMGLFGSSGGGKDSQQLGDLATIAKIVAMFI